MSKQLPPTGDRIAKFLARAGVASRREVERMIAAGRITLNGTVLDTPAVKVSQADTITVDDKPVGAPDTLRVWRYYKPNGLVTTDRDEKGRRTIFDALPETLPRVMSVGRLDLNSEGLLLLTNDGELKRKLELPSTGWVRKYRVRIKGYPSDALLEPLRQGITVDGEKFRPMAITIDRQQGANAWLTIGITEGKNREIRRALNSVDLSVNRLIRTSYGPFQLMTLEPGEVEEVRMKVLRDQLGLKKIDDEQPAPKSRNFQKSAKNKRPPKRRK
ncbi:MAG: pseudouridine synthase [Rhodobacterales bacterium]